MSGQENVDLDEIAKFEKLASRWWDPHSEFKPLHDINPLRAGWIDEHADVAGKNVVDVGCGGGLLAEPMARLGATVTGIDVTEAAIMAATVHAKQASLDIDYLCSTAEDLASTGVTFEVIYASEVIEHVADRGLFIRAIARMLDPKGVVIVTTINRSLPALLLAKFALEYVVRLVPAGTHDPQKFVRPNELRWEFAAAGIMLDDMTGLTPRPSGGFKQTGSLAINYAASGGFI